MDLAIVLDGWPYDRKNEAANIRKVAGVDGRLKLQVRLRSGVVQWEVEGRPDGARPRGFDSVLAWCRSQIQLGVDAFELDEGVLAELERELQDYDRRRQVFLIIGDYVHALSDARHGIGILDLIRTCVEEPDLAFRYDRMRPRMISDMARAAAFLEIRREKTGRASRLLTRAIRDIEDFLLRYDLGDQLKKNRERHVLIDLRRSLRERHGIPLTDGELLETLKAEQQVAITRENYEMAARLRDKIHGLMSRLDRTG